MISRDIPDTLTGHVEGSAICSPVPMFPGTYVPRTLFPGTYVPRYRSVFPEPIFPGTYFHRCLCSPNLCSAVPMFPGTYVPRCHELSLPLNRVCTGQSSDSERAHDQWQCAAVTPQVNLTFSFVSCISKHFIPFSDWLTIFCLAVFTVRQIVH